MHNKSITQVKKQHARLYCCKTNAPVFNNACQRSLNVSQSQEIEPESDPDNEGMQRCWKGWSAFHYSEIVVVVVVVTIRIIIIIVVVSFSFITFVIKASINLFFNISTSVCINESILIIWIINLFSMCTGNQLSPLHVEICAVLCFPIVAPGFQFQSSSIIVSFCWFDLFTPPQSISMGEPDLFSALETIF